MKKHTLSFRHIHLDFHTSEHIEGIGSAFDKKRFQETLQEAEVSSVTAFACCHHGWSYHPTNVNRQHPHLTFNLLREQMDAAHEIGVKMPVYLTAGVHNLAAREHPEWRTMGYDGQFIGWTPRVIDPGFHNLCFNTPYLDHLCAQIGEVMELFPDADGIFTDIISESPCCCTWCLAEMEAEGLDAANPEHRNRIGRRTLEKYYRRTTETVTRIDPDMPLFHNGGHIHKKHLDRLRYFSHLELESLPTGGWGYDHFPLSAKFAETLGYDYLGMTGKFHLTWGEFGGYKHPNALRYECAAMLAHGAKCSVGDQLHPTGELNRSTYRIIGEAYREVKAKEPWCSDTRNVADIALISHESLRGMPLGEINDGVDTGATRLLLEGHYLFDIIHPDAEFDPYRALILPDDFDITDDLEHKLRTYLSKGGKLILSGKSGLNDSGFVFAAETGASHHGPSPFQPDYVNPSYAGDEGKFALDPIVFYATSQRIRVTTGTSLGQIHDPYFNRDYRHFCSHQHTPNRPEPSGYDAGVMTDQILYFAHPVFSLYHQVGAVAYKEFVTDAMDRFLGNCISFRSNLPSTARVVLRDQPKENCYVLHLLYGPATTRGSAVEQHGGNLASKSMAVELIEDLPPLVDIQVELKTDKRILTASVEPDGIPISFQQQKGMIRLDIDRFTCHRMLVLTYES